MRGRRADLGVDTRSGLKRKFSKNGWQVGEGREICTTQLARVEKRKTFGGVREEEVDALLATKMELGKANRGRCVFGIFCLTYRKFRFHR